VWEGGEGQSYWRLSMEGEKNAPTNVVIRPRPPAAIPGYTDINHLRVPLRVPHARKRDFPENYYPPRYVNVEIRGALQFRIVYNMYITPNT